MVWPTEKARKNSMQASHALAAVPPGWRESEQSERAQCTGRATSAMGEGSWVRVGRSAGRRSGGSGLVDHLKKWRDAA